MILQNCLHYLNDSIQLHFIWTMRRVFMALFAFQINRFLSSLLDNSRLNDSANNEKTLCKSAAAGKLYALCDRRVREPELAQARHGCVGRRGMWSYNIIRTFEVH